MNYRVFQYPLPTPPELAELNAYLASHRVAEVTHHLAPMPGGSMLVFVVQTAAGQAGTEVGAGRSKIDFRTELNEEDFSVFSRLRDWRKKVAESEGVPVYTVFTNAQLAELVTKKVTTPEALRQIEGIGTARAEKYGSGLLEMLCPRVTTPPSSTQ